MKSFACKSNVFCDHQSESETAIKQKHSLLVVVLLLFLLHI